MFSRIGFFNRKNKSHPGYVQPRSIPEEYIPSCQSTVHIGVIDCSSSMDTPDYPPTRLEAGKKAFSAFASKRREHYPDDGVGLVIFDDSPTIIFPPQRIGNHLFMNMLQENLQGITPAGGTNLGWGLQEALMLCEYIDYPEYSFAFRFLVLTDGHSAGDPLRISHHLKGLGVVIEIVGIGGAPSDVNELLLKECASVENGILLYRFIGDGDSQGLVEHFGRIALR